MQAGLGRLSNHFLLFFKTFLVLYVAVLIKDLDIVFCCVDKDFIVGGEVHLRFLSSTRLSQYIDKPDTIKRLASEHTGSSIQAPQLQAIQSALQVSLFDKLLVLIVSMLLPCQVCFHTIDSVLDRQ